jgi:hypothetical protein
MRRAANPASLAALARGLATAAANRSARIAARASSSALTGATKPIAREPDYAAERRLPDGVTCAACVHAPRCDALFGAVRRAFTSCDFSPSRYKPSGEQIFSPSFAAEEKKPSVGVRPPAAEGSDPPPTHGHPR